MMIRIFSITSMVLGGMIYVLWRPDSLRMFSWFVALGIDQPITNMRNWSAALSGILPQWVYLSLPQSLWLLSGCLAIHSIWGDFWRRREQLWMTLVLCLALGGELGQATGTVGGVFDYLDLAMIFIAFIVAQTIAFIATRHPEGRETICR